MTVVDEFERLAALRSYEILGTPADARFEALTKLTAIALGLPIAFISLVDSDRHWFWACYGIDPSDLSDDSFFDHRVAAEAPLIVPDILQDSSFLGSTLANGRLRARSYVAVPLRNRDGMVLGTLCGIGHEPRQLTETEMETLALLADQVVALLELLRDASRLRAVQAHLNQLMATLDSTKDAILIFDPTSLQFSYANQGAVKQFGYTVDELLQMTPLDLKPDSDEAHYRRTLDPLMAGQSKVITFETLHTHRNGHQIPVEIILQYLNPPDEEPRFINIVRDISERYRADKIKSEFVSTVSHELRTPLTSIRGSLGLVAKGITGPLPKQAEEFVEIALANCERLVRLINDILDIEKIASGTTELRYRLVNLVGAVNKAMESNESFARAEGATLVVTEEMPGIEVLVDEDRLIQVLTNLISNAAKASPAGRPVELSMALTESRVRVKVRDHGAGIPDVFKNRLFQRFAQGDSSDSRGKGGTGLGLSIAKTLIESMNGDIGFETAPGTGTTFFFDLPYLWAPEERDNASGTSTDRVLVCEDDLDAAHVIMKTLEQAGCVVHVAPTLERARALLTEFHYRIVTLDLTLADGEAGILLSEIRRNSANSEVPVVVISGASATERRALLGPAATAVADILQKPIDEGRLLEAIRDLWAYKDTAPRVLHVEDDEDVRRIVKRLLPQDWEVMGAKTVADAKTLLDQQPYDLVLLDLLLPDGGGETILEHVGAAEVVVFSVNDASPKISRRVSESLVKTRATEFQLRDAVVALMAKLMAKRRDP